MAIAAGQGVGRDQDFDAARVGDAKHAEAEPPAEIAEPGVALAALAALRDPGGDPDFVAGGGAVDRLQHEFEIEGELEFADDHDRGLVADQRQEIAAADLSLDGRAEVFEEGLDRGVERRFQADLSASSGR